ncbi:MAG: hypothetical protein HZC51_08230 [Nitrospirae bacterium]|nr:hypothetical protein [Nitrospirota bacterium]
MAKKVGSDIDIAQAAKLKPITEIAKKLGGKMEFIPNKEDILAATLAHIDKKREDLKLRKYEKGKFGVEKVLLDMAARRKLEAGAHAHQGVGGV